MLNSESGRSGVFSPGTGRWAWIPLIVLVATWSGPTPARAQPRSEQFLLQQRAIEEQVRSELNTALPADRETDIDWGGWYSFYLFLYDDGLNSSRTFRQNDLRLWTSASFHQGAHQFYVRGKLQYQDFNSGDSFSGDDNDWVGPNLDRGFYQFDLKRAMQFYRQERIDWNLNLKGGRDYVQFGTGYALSTPLDHVLATLELGDWRVQGLAGAAIGSTDNIDASHPDNSNSDRNFWGAQVVYTGFEKHKPFVYWFLNEDQLREKPISLFQNWDYDSWYVGFGSDGELLRNLRYATEWVFEGGDTYGNGRWMKRDDIQAWAWDINLTYLSQLPMRPRITGEYMFASGDADRRFSPTDSVGGNERGDDQSFSAFGYRDTGLSLTPRLSNLHIWRAGVAFTPFEKIEALRNLELGTDWFLYCKNRRTGAISDPTADVGSNFVGWEMDYFANWRITSDVSWTTRFGTFFPGASFSDQTTRTFWMTGITWSF